MFDSFSIDKLFNQISNFFQTTVDTDKLISVLKYDANNPLLFNTGLFLILFVAFILIYQIVRRWRTAKFLFVIAFSLYFYYKSSAECCFILLGVCVSDYLLGLAMEKLKTNGVVVYNLGTGTGYSVLDMVKTFEKVNNVKVPYKIAPRRAGDLAEMYADPTKAKEELEDMCRDSWNFAQNVK